MTENFTILVVDDNALNRDALSRRLERKGYQVLIAEDGYRAIGLVGQQAVDLILLDIMMPGITGLDVLKILRQNHSPATLPIIMATAKDQNEDMVMAFDLGANDYITKPINFPVLLARVQAHLRMKTATSGLETKPLLPATAETQIRPGITLADRYQLEARIGEGAFGTVYRALHVGLQHPIAVKILKASVATTPEALARFQHEGITACRVQHPNAVSIYDFGVTPSGAAYLVMELLSGRSLEAEMAREGKLSPQRCAQILQPIGAVLEVAHEEGIIHRDLKPANIFLHQARQGEVVKVVDFGIAKLLDKQAASTLTQENLVGTPNYMPPERILNQPYDGRSDVYSLGIMLYEMLSGKRPFESQDSVVATVMMHLEKEPLPLRQFAPDLSPALEAIVLQSLQKEPEARPSVTELVSKFTEAVNEEI